MQINLVGGWTYQGLRTYDRLFPLAAVPVAVGVGISSAINTAAALIFFTLLIFLWVLHLLVGTELDRRNAQRERVALGVRRIHQHSDHVVRQIWREHD